MNRDLQQILRRERDSGCDLKHFILIIACCCIVLRAYAVLRENQGSHAENSVQETAPDSDDENPFADLEHGVSLSNLPDLSRGNPDRRLHDYHAELHEEVRRRAKRFVADFFDMSGCDYAAKINEKGRIYKAKLKEIKEVRQLLGAATGQSKTTNLCLEKTIRAYQRLVCG